MAGLKSSDICEFHPGPLRGNVRVPGDKSISHRALIIGAASKRPLRIRNLNPGLDVRATRETLAALGTQIEYGGESLTVTGGALHRPAHDLDCMNSGSTARMLLGACAGANIAARFTGDESLSRRPMEPAAAQLRAFGAAIRTTDGCLPLEIDGTQTIQTRRFILLAPSAQVKTALLFAALFRSVNITVTGDRNSRDHTERLLRFLGAQILWDGKTVTYTNGRLDPKDVDIVGDFSSAAFFITAAAITPGSDLVIRDVGVNPTRTGLLDGLRAMGASIDVYDAREVSGEPVASIHVRHAPLHGISLATSIADRANDEIPLIAVAAAFAEGLTTITGVGDLRAKESDRIEATKRLLFGVGTQVETLPTGLRVYGGSPQATGSLIETRGDHRTAMAAAVLACAAGPISIDRADSIGVSFPGFITTLASVRAT